MAQGRVYEPGGIKLDAEMETIMIIEHIMGMRVWSWSDQYTRFYSTSYIMGGSLLELIRTNRLLFIVEPIVGILLTLWYMMILYLLTLILRSRILADAAYIGLLIYVMANPLSPKESNGLTYVIPIGVIIMSIIYGSFPVRQNKSAERMTTYYQVDAPWMSTIDGNLLVGMVYLLIGGIIISVTGKDSPFATFFSVGMVLLMMQKAPMIGSNSSAMVVLLLAGGIFMSMSGISEALVMAISKMVNHLLMSPNYSNPTVTIEPVQTVKNMWSRMTFFGPQESSGIFYLIRSILGTIMQVAMMLDEFMGPGVAVKAGVKLSLKEDRDVPGYLGNFISPWILVTLLHWLINILFAGEMAIFCTIVGGFLGTVYWLLIMKPVWQGRGFLSSLTKTHPCVEIATGQGPVGMRTFTSLLLSGVCVYVKSVESKSSMFCWDVASLVTAMAYKKCSVSVLGWMSGNVALLFMPFFSREVLAGEVHKNSMLGTGDGATGTNSCYGIPHVENTIVDDFIDITTWPVTFKMEWIINNIMMQGEITPGRKDEIVSWARKSKKKIFWELQEGNHVLYEGKDFWMYSPN